MKTTSYEISKQLKEAGFEAEFNFHYKATDHCNLYDSGYEDYKDRNTPAYDLETILDALKQTRKRIMIVVKSDNWGINFDYQFNKYSQENESLADTAGRMWLMLKEKGIIC